MKRLSGIYKITSPTGRIYIGQSRNINARFNAYKYYERDYKSLKQRDKKSLIINSFIKHGYTLHKFEIIELCDETLLNQKEIWYIDFYKTNILKYPNGNGLNLHEGGNKPPIKVYNSIETKQKISIKNKQNHKLGKYEKVAKSILKFDKFNNLIIEYKSITEMTKSEGFTSTFFYKNFYEFNKFYYKEFIFCFKNPIHFKYKLKIKKPSKQIKIVDSTSKSDKLSKFALNRKSRSEWGEFFTKINTGRKHVNRKIAKITEKRLRHYYKLHKNNQIPVNQYDIHGNFISSFNSLKSAAQAVNGKYQSIYRVCTGKRNTAYGFKWEYLVDFSPNT